ncbi:hypothetical protein CFR76_04815 [Komagataeibacter swingsii]|uniref:Uncharacterized protein n=1 Tax=Komagataeibacter swingsii TaxID=215220 RepID=A0A2V4S534_9PROT|nr:hypothetical protein CFR76_04815 [Komagataeibacter swingsii]
MKGQQHYISDLLALASPFSSGNASNTHPVIRPYNHIPNTKFLAVPEITLKPAHIIAQFAQTDINMINDFDGDID